MKQLVFAIPDFFNVFHIRIFQLHLDQFLLEEKLHFMRDSILKTSSQN